jgi:peptidoglycan hydrolase-like protein with peptidoglycan-binding domain
LQNAKAALGNTTGSFSRDLQIGSTGDDVKLLQQYLNNNGFTVSASGAGSPGNETSRFGAATKAALIKYQESVGITPASGYFGPKTRAQVSGGAPASSESMTVTPVETSTGGFARDLKLGSTGADVKRLQEFLNANGFVIAESGPGSPGNETTTFGRATKAALIKYQESVGITPASGNFGPKTRASMGGN